MAGLLFGYYEPKELKLVEDKKTGKVRIRGVFATADKPTLNGRIYPLDIWEREVDKLNGLIQERKLFGELDHPEDGRTQLSRVSHLITDLHLDGNSIIGEAEVFDTERGRNLKAVVKGGGHVGVSSRGTGSTVAVEDGVEKVQDDFELISFDFVAAPADESAYPEVFLEEKRRKYMEELTLERLKKERPDLVDSIHKEHESELKELFAADITKIKQEVEDNTKKALEEKFKKALLSGIEQARADIEKKIREEVKKEEGKVDNSVLEEVKKRLVEFEAQMKMLASKYYLYSTYGKRSDIKKVIESLGKLSEYKNFEEFKDKADKVVKGLGEDRMITLIKELKVGIDGVSQKIEVVETERDRYREGMGKALNLAKELSLQVAGHEKKEQTKEDKKVIDKKKEEVKEKIDELAAVSTEFTSIRESLKEKKVDGSPLSEEFESLGVDLGKVAVLATK